MKVAIVTGASSGIGKEFVKQLDKSEPFDEIWVIARREERLAELQDGINAKIKPIALDLTESESYVRLSEILREENPEVRVLVNASGFEKFGAFEETPLEDLLGMIDLNDKAVVSMSYLVKPYMQENSCIYQLASVAAFQPIPYINVYAATKAFVVSFSRALNVEFKKYKIRSMAVCPFWTKTEFFDRAVSDNTVKYYARYLTAEQVVKKAIRDMKKGKELSICQFANWLQALAVKLLPHKLIMKIWCKQQDLQG